MKNTAYILKIVFLLILFAPILTIAQNNLELYGHSGVNKSLGLAGVGLVYKYNFEKKKINIGIGLGNELNYMHDAINIIHEDYSGYKTPYKFTVLGYNYLLYFEMGNKLIRYYLTPELSRTFTLTADYNGSRHKGLNYGFTSGVKFYLPTKKNSVTLFAGYQLENRKIRVWNSYHRIDLETINHYLKLGFGINLSKFFTKERKR